MQNVCSSLPRAEPQGYCLFAWYQLRPREKEAFNYAEKLKEKYGHHPEVRRIVRHRHVPKAIHSARKELRTIRTSQKKKYVNCLRILFLCLIILASDSQREVHGVAYVMSCSKKVGDGFLLLWLEE